MRRSAAAATLALALLAVAASVAAAKGGGALVKVKAPAVGKGSAQVVTVKVTGAKPGPPKVKVTNLAALGKGFGGAAVITGPKKPSGHAATYKVHLILYMGNAGKASTSTIQLQLTPPAGDTVTPSPPEPDVCAGLRSLAALHGIMLDDSGSTFSGFYGSMFGFLCPK